MSTGEVVSAINVEVLCKNDYLAQMSLLQNGFIQVSWIKGAYMSDSIVRSGFFLWVDGSKF